MIDLNELKYHQISRNTIQLFEFQNGQMVVDEEEIINTPIIAQSKDKLNSI